MKFQVDRHRTLPLPVLLDVDIDINLKIDNLGEVKKNLTKLKHKLAFCDNSSDQVHVHRLIGVDIIQGKCHHFLYKQQVTRARVKRSAPENNYQTIISGYSACPEARVNYVSTLKKAIRIHSQNISMKVLLNISPKVNIIARPEFELAYYDFAVHRFNHYTSRTTAPPHKQILLLPEGRRKKSASHSTH